MLDILTKKINSNLEKSLKNWEPLLNSIETCLLKDDWKLVREIQIPIEESLEEIKKMT